MLATPVFITLCVISAAVGASRQQIVVDEGTVINNVLKRRQSTLPQSSPELLVQLKNGRVVPLSMCLLRDHLEDDSRRIANDMSDFGIPESTCFAFSNWVTHEAAVPTMITDQVVCLPSENVRMIGKRLGSTIREYIFGYRNGVMPTPSGVLEQVVDDGMIPSPSNELEVVSVQTPTPRKAVIVSALSGTAKTNWKEKTKKSQPSSSSSRGENGPEGKTLQGEPRKGDDISDVFEKDDDTPNSMSTSKEDDRDDSDLDRGEDGPPVISSGGSQPSSISTESESSDDSGNGRLGNFEFKNDEEELRGRGACCKCAEGQFPIWKNGGTKSCWRGPCCPNLCKTLKQLEMVASEGVWECCENSKMPCDGKGKEDEE